jgi:hypothetical protein
MPEIDRPDEKAKEIDEAKLDPFTQKTALTIALYSVFLTITALGGNNAMKDMLLAQQQASDQWAFYQAKVIRENFCRTQKIHLELDLLEKGALRKDLRERYESTLQQVKQEEERYHNEKKEIEAEARKLEEERNRNRAKDPYFDFAEVFLQMAIIMASVSILANARSTSRFLYIFSLAVAIMGGILSMNGFLLLFRIPFFH